MSRARCLIAVIALVALIAPGCKSRDEWLFSVQTNLPVPQFGDRLYIEVLMKMGQPIPAFQAAERRRARSLLDSLTEARSDIRRGVDAALLEKDRKSVV